MKVCFKLFICIALCIALALGLCSCGKDMTLYNTPAGDREVDKKSVESVIKNAVLSEFYESLKSCEAVVPAYVEIDKKESEKKSIYYIAATVGGYTVSNGKLSRTHGATPYAAVVQLKKTDKGEYQVTNFLSNRSIEEQEERVTFIEKNFPKGKNTESVISGQRDVLYNMEMAEIEAIAGQDKYEFADEDEVLELLPISDYAYMDIMEFFDKYPDWIGSKVANEEDGKYTYETLYQPEGDEGSESGVISFVKKNEKGEEVERTDIKVNGDYIEYINGEAPEISDFVPDEQWEEDFNYDDGITYVPVDIDVDGDGDIDYDLDGDGIIDAD